MKKEGHPGFAGCLFVCGGALSVTAGAVPASRLPPRVLSASGRRPAPTDAAAETGRWATSHRDVAAPEGGAKSRLPLWGRWTRVSEDGEGKLPAAPSHGLCRSAGELPSQSPSGDSSSEGRAKSRLPPWGRWTRVSEDGEGQVPAAPSYGLCGSAGGRPSQSPSGDSSPKGGAKYVRYQKLAQSQVSPPPLGGAGAQWAPFSA